MSIQRVTGSAVSSVVEANFALNHMNFDFSLVKIEAPEELRPLGKLLSDNRKSSAEDGPFHILARRLGALFDDILPAVPSLLTAYGRRASEIAETMDKEARKSSIAAGSPFWAHFGVDSTSIWAAATSSKSALRVHLLACMLASIWSAQEATAIWFDLIVYRQARIKEAVEQDGGTANAMAYAAALHSVDQSAISEWDASARAWLEVADKAKAKQQTQIKLILDNLSVPVVDMTRRGMGPDSQASLTRGMLYNNVISNACEALSTLNNLVEGMPQRVSSGGVLLALKSWHIYPDLVLLGGKTVDVYQEDSLVVRSGVATLTFSTQSDHAVSSHDAESIKRNPKCSGTNKGVYWSLALSSLRYYGTVERSRSTLHDTRRVSIPQLQLLALGAMLDRECIFSLKLSVRIIEFVTNSLVGAIQGTATQHAETSSEVGVHLASLKEDPVTGQFSEPSRPSGEEETEQRNILHSLRLISCLSSGIELFHSREKSELEVAHKLASYGARHGKQWMSCPESSTSPRLFGLGDLRTLLHCLTQNERISLLCKLCSLRNTRTGSSVIRYRSEVRGGAWVFMSPHQKRNHEQHTRKRMRYDPSTSGYQESSLREVTTPSDESWTFIHDDNTHPMDFASSGSYSDDESFSNFIQDPPEETQTVVFYDILFGDPTVAAVYARREQGKQKAPQKDGCNNLPLDVLWDLLQAGSLKVGAVADMIVRTLSTRQSLRDSMLLLGKISRYYMAYLPQATVNVEVIRSSMLSWNWCQAVLSYIEESPPNKPPVESQQEFKPAALHSSNISRASVFAMILQLESGNISCTEGEMRDVMALSRGNSLFVAKRLVCDPTDVPDDQVYVVEHILGNIGKPGIALMVAPAALEIRPHRIDEWHYSNHAKFEGERAIGAFNGTSLHLSFTGYEVSLSGELTGLRTNDAFFLETIISVEDRGSWVGDIDVLKAFESDKRVQRFEAFDGSCSHHEPSFAHSHLDLEMTSIDSWEELIDPPESIMVVRAGTSWMARVAAVSIASSKGYTCCYGPPQGDFCWKCFLERACGSGKDPQEFRRRTDILFLY